MKTLYCWNIQLTGLDVSKNTALTSLIISEMSTLNEVCVWELPFPPEGVKIDTTGSPNVCFETDCNGACSTTGIEEQSVPGLSIYPNLATDILTIKTSVPGQRIIEITSLNGKLLYNSEVERPTHQIDLSSFQKGLYFITIRSKDHVRTEKIVKL